MLTKDETESEQRNGAGRRTRQRRADSLRGCAEHEET